MLPDFNGALRSIPIEKKTRIYLRAYLGVTKSMMRCTKKIPSLMSIIVSTVFNDLSGL